MSEPMLAPFLGLSDPFSSVSHLLGAVLFACAGAALLRKVRRAPLTSFGPRIAAMSVYIAAGVLLLLMSSTFHALTPGTQARALMQRMDHAAIFVFIAATYTPIHAIMFRGPWRWGMLVFIWTAGLLGVALKSVYFAQTPPALGLLLYVAMGWGGLVSMILLARRFGLGFITHLVTGGLTYTAGAMVELFNPPALLPGVIRSHEIFHVAVLAGMLLHGLFIWRIADAPPAASPA